MNDAARRAAALAHLRELAADGTDEQRRRTELLARAYAAEDRTGPAMLLRAEHDELGRAWLEARVMERLAFNQYRHVERQQLRRNPGPAQPWVHENAWVKYLEEMLDARDAYLARRPNADQEPP